MASFADSYPTITRWIEEQGWIEIGRDEYSSSLVRALDPGGMFWESDSSVDSIDDALQELEKELMGWFRKNKIGKSCNP
ncbi:MULTISPECIES: hypothetical protein [unclassified Nitrosomonas]|uniref:hypothetical protein n=1 Tax=unclassified Nitrosomonas TaxID=2609265 RepID=UPI000899FFB7|nr:MULTISPECIES: hypothetical protein [unclassified Nitrosomonas]MDV6343034.1 hypothetical protein [Nitrosomonas sp. Is37]SDY92177.1 hypothetical protein SAMN05421755_10658 [Nitrosomonas sp. Nm33]